MNWRYIDKYLNNGGRLSVGPNQNEVWDLNSEDVQLIGLVDNGAVAGAGRNIWVLSHLDYPLVYGVEEFGIFTATVRGHNHVADALVRTFSLVDVSNRA